jgi:hypothetical protein
MARIFLAVVVVLLSSSHLARPARAARRESAIPPPLRPWIPWVLDSDEGKSALCPVSNGEDVPECVWPSRLLVSLDKRGGAFSQEWRVFAQSLVPLPGDKERWPTQVTVDGKRSPVADQKDGPKVLLPAGLHRVAGRFTWDALPEELQVPPETGLVTLLIPGREVAGANRAADGRLFLGPSEAEKAEPDAVDISVHRKLADGSPLLLTTLLNLSVSGKNRELALGRALPDGFEPVRVDSPLPLRVDGQGRITLQARPGSHTVELLARRMATGAGITRPVPDGLWKDGEEAWSFEEQPTFRRVKVSGAPAIDPAQTTLPREWKSFPAFALAPGATLVLTEQSRGNTQVPPDKLALRRTLWLDMDGRGWSTLDEIQGTATTSWRLEADRELRLGRVLMAGQDSFITRLGKGGRPGVELRDYRGDLLIENRIEGLGATVPANGYARGFDQISATVNLPPGYRLLHATGMDEVRGTWCSAWSVLDLCLFALCVVLAGRLFGLRLALLAAVALGLSFLEIGAPQFVWLLALVGEGLSRLFRGTQVARFARWVRPATFIVLGIALLFFAADQVLRVLQPGRMTDGVLTRVLGHGDGDRDARFMNYSLTKPKELPQYPAEMGRNAGILGMLAKGQSVASIFGRDAALGREEAEMGELVGSTAGGGGLGEEQNMSGLSGRRHKGEEGKMGQRASRYALKAPASNYGPPSSPSPKRNLEEYDPSMQVQTGFGMPTWNRAVAEISFQGPVGEGKVMRFYILPPWAMRAIAVAQLLLLVLLARAFWRRSLRLPPAASAAPMAATLALVLALWPSAAAAQTMPGEDILKELRTRLLPPPLCDSECASLDDVIMDGTPGGLRLRLRGSALLPTAIPLPTDLASWSPTRVLVDGKPATALRRDDERLWVWVAKGAFAIELSGPTLRRESIQIPLPMAPHRAVARLSGYTIDGIHEDGAVDDSVQLTAEEKPRSDGASDQPSTTPSLPPFLRVERTLHLGLKWEVHTVVTRQGVEGTPVVAEIPLLPGESVTTPKIRVDTGKPMVNLNLGPNDSSVEWDSTLVESKTLRLWFDPATASRLSERWTVDVGPTWHAAFAGIPPMLVGLGQPQHLPEWRPWPGEEARITLEKPMGAPGQSLTIDASHLTLVPGPRQVSARLAIGLRASSGTEHRIRLPVGAVVESVMRDGSTQAIDRDGQALRLAIPPGKHTFEIAWRSDASMALFFQTPEVDLGLPSVNHQVGWDLSGSRRWIAWLSGPAQGPVIHWGFVLLALAFVAWRLGKSGFAPLRAHQWFLLCLCLLLVSDGPAIGIMACLLGLGWRNRCSLPPSHYNAGQIAAGVGLGLCLVAWFIDFTNLRFMRPPTTLTGGSGPLDALVWSQDRVAGILPRPWMVSLPAWAYHAILLLLGICLAMQVPRLAPFVWNSFKHEGLWKRPTLTAP